VWAPASTAVSVVLLSSDALTAGPGSAREPARPEHDHPLEAEPDGYFSGLIAEARPGSLYHFRLDGGERFADPASRFQPQGPHGPSQVIDPSTFRWTDDAWLGVPRTDLVVYELHIGTFTPAGTWRSAVAELAAVAELGVTALEVMPVADFPGTFGWGYDGVNLFAPTRLYGPPDDFRAFVDAAHGLGLAVILDVVYNHFGPDGCCLERFAPAYFSDESTEWGRSLNFDGEDSGPVREFFTANAGYWIDEYHLDGLRLDATQAIIDRSGQHILTEVAGAVRAAAGPRRTWIVCENEPQHTEMVRRPDDGGLGLDAMWNDDFHHSAIVALTGRREAYYRDYLGTPQELLSAVKHGFLYQGQWYSWQQKPRGTPTTGVPADAFVTFLENHDQVANSWNGLRLHARTSPGRLRALTALLLLAPSTPMLFQGQEFASSAPFLYFADHAGDLGAAVRDGRRDFLSQFASVAQAQDEDALPDPGDRRTFERCRLDPAERDRHATSVALHASLLQLRASDAAFRNQGRCGVDGTVLAPQAFALRFFSQPPCADGIDDRLLVVNLGVQVDLESMPEPLLAPPRQCQWTPIWSSEDPLYGGAGTPDLDLGRGWRLPAECAIVLGATADRRR
jgi:maltooligosyltrehalose trehalohydrolase